MSQPVAELLATVYRFYARGLQHEDQGYKNTQEYRRLFEARIQAGADGNPWRVLLNRLSVRFPTAPNGTIQNGSLHLPTGGLDAGYVGSFSLESRSSLEKNRMIGFLISFIVPYYVVYSSTHVAVPKRDSQGWSQQIRFTFTPEEEPYAQAITEEILSVFPGYEPMPQELGNVIVPEVVAGNMPLGKATLYHCVFTDAW